MKSIEIIKKEDSLSVCYTPSINFKDIVRRLKEGDLYVKRTFWVSKNNIEEVNEDEGYITFRIAIEDNDYYCLDKDVFDLKNTIFIEKNLDITDLWFVSYPHTSVFSIIDRMLSYDLYIVSEDDGIENHLLAKDYIALINVFPNAYEKDKYAKARIAYLLSNYVEGMWNHKESYEKYLEKKELSLTLREEQDIKLMGYEMYKKAVEELGDMLNNLESYSEKLWQEKIYRIICVLYPKYISSFREIEVGSDGRHAKIPDFLLVDSSGFVDILEIKKPDNKKVVSSSEYRNNYVAGRDLEGAIVQIEKYIYILNHEGESRVRKIREQISGNLPKGIEIRVINPQGILLLGRSEGLSKEQLYDFEIIKRQHKNIIDIMTYDDLLFRLNNILKQMDSNKSGCTNVRD